MGIEKTIRQRKIRHLELAPLVCIESRTSLGDVIKAMQAQKVGCVLLTEKHKLAGIFTERDLVTKVIGESVEYSQAVKDFMSPRPTTLNPDDTLAAAIDLMDRGGYRHVPLVDEHERLLGLLAVSNVIDFLAEHFPQEVLALPPRPDQTFEEPDGA